MLRKEKKVRAKAANGHQLAEHIPAGQVFTDLHKQSWILGQSIGVGGFGEIYSASNDLTRAVGPRAEFVIKVEPHANGPLFSEIHAYLRLGKTESIDEWKTARKLKFLGMPKFLGSGSHDYDGNKYRFMVMQRFGNDLQKFWTENGKKFSTKTVLSLGIQILDVLEYIHNCGYVHCDIKASNLLVGFKSCEQVYLVDFGLACRYVSAEGVHKPNNPDPKKAHDGTIEFTSRDAHVGKFSRRGDLEILAYNMLQWSCGKLPWEKDLKNLESVKTQKIEYLKDVPRLFDECYRKMAPCPGLKRLFEHVLALGFDEIPDYDFCRRILREALAKAGCKDDGKLDLKKIVVDSPRLKRGAADSPRLKRGAVESPKLKRGAAESPKLKRIVSAPVKIKRETKRTCQKMETSENSSEVLPVAKPVRSSSRKPCALAQSNRVTRSSSKIEKSICSTVTDIPTPAMIEIMEIKRKKEDAKLAKLAKNSKTVKRSSLESNKGGKRVKRNIEISPDLF